MAASRVGRRTLGDSWAVGLATACLALGAPGLLLGSFHLLEWSAVCLVLLAFAGRRARWAATGAATLAGLGGLYVAADLLRKIGGPADLAHWSYVVGGLLVVALTLVQLAGRVPRSRRLDPVVLVAIQLAVGLVARWSYEFISGAGLNPNLYGPNGWTTPFAVELPILALGFAGVGLGVSRGWRDSLTRLGIARPTWWQALAAVLAALAVGLVDVPANMLAYWLTPDALDAISAIVDKTQLGLGLALVFAVLAGISEEVLFRGALQPRAGIVITALLFTAIHVHYGATPIAASVFVAGLAYGWLRRHMNTTTAIMAHAMTDIAASLPSGFARFGLLFVAVAIAFAAIRADGYSWSRYLVPPAVAGVFSVLGSGVVALTGSATAWRAFGVAAFLAMAVAVAMEGLRSRSRVLVGGGVAAFLAAAVIQLSIPWPGPTRWMALPAWLISLVAGVGVWYRLASSRYEEEVSVAD